MLANAARLAPIVLSAALLATCGGTRPAQTLSNEPAKAAATGALADGSYACEFVVDSTPFGPHHCQVAGGTLTKTSGMEPFTGAISGTEAEVHVDAQIGCTPMSVKCHEPFTVTLTPGAGGVWRGAVAGKGEATWWLNNAQFEIGPDGSLGGAGYGGGELGED